MGIIENVGGLSWDQIEDIEKLTMRWLFQAVLDFGFDAYDIFYNSPDDVKDVAEDITRELLDRLPGYNVPQRIFGTVDYKRARYIILPEHLIRQALFVDSKAEKSCRTATIQMSQTSMKIRQIRGDRQVEEQGLLQTISKYGGHQYLTTTALLHYHYDDDSHQRHKLSQVTLASIPNGMLQDRYNPDMHHTIWLAGRNAPSLGELFRVRLSFSALKKACTWRVQRVSYDESGRMCIGTWSE
jgi:hypothetical protein